MTIEIRRAISTLLCNQNVVQVMVVSEYLREVTEPVLITIKEAVVIIITVIYLFNDATISTPH